MSDTFNLITFTGEVTDVKENTSKNGKKYATFYLKDLDDQGKLSCIVWNSDYIRKLSGIIHIEGVFEFYKGYPKITVRKVLQVFGEEPSDNPF